MNVALPVCKVGITYACCALKSDTTSKRSVEIGELRECSLSYGLRVSRPVFTGELGRKFGYGGWGRVLSNIVQAARVFRAMGDRGRFIHR